MRLQQEFNFRSLMVKDEDGRYRHASSEEITEAALSEVTRRFSRGAAIFSPEETKAFLQLKLAHLEHEVFAVLWLDNRHRVIAFDELFRGTIDGASVHPREVVKTAMRHNAAACIFAHNHPSGIAEPSQADQRITQRLKEALSLVDVRTLDHVIVAENTCSFAERGLM
jgi:DNA repair protein RadC